MNKNVAFGMIVLLGAVMSAPSARAGDGADAFWNGSAGASASGPGKDNDDDGEQQERDVDQAALSSQDVAIRELKGLLKRYQNTPEEAGYLFRLAEIEQQSASMDFRVGYGRAIQRAGNSANLKGFKSTLEDSVTVLDRLLHQYPKFEQTAKATYMRARAHEELGDTRAATRDYLTVVGKHPKSSEAVPAYMSLSSFSMQASRYKEAVAYLKHVEAQPQSPYYPFALYELAWGSQSLKQSASALAYSERLVAYYRQPTSGEQSDQALKAKVLDDVPVFFYSAFEAGQPQRKAADALAYFKKLGQGAELEKMLALYAKLLRSNDQSKELSAFNALVLASEGKHADSYELVLTEFENDLNQSRYPEIGATAKELPALHARSKDAVLKARAEKLVLDGALRMQNRFGKAASGRNADYTKQLSSTLEALYSAFAQMVPADDVRLRTVHFNLGETLFAVGEFDQASQPAGRDYFDRAADQYRWIVQNGSWSESVSAKSKSGGMTVVEASLKAIASRYEALRRLKLIPADLQAESLAGDSKGETNPKLGEWIAWIDEHRKKTGDGIENFQFEGNRALYFQKKIALAVTRLRAFAFENPKSRYAVPSATLVVDSYLASSDWKALAEISRDLGKRPEWKGTPFESRVTRLAADAHFRQAQVLASHHDYDHAIEQADGLKGLYGNTAHNTDALALAGDAALAKHDSNLALSYYSRLAATAPKSDAAAKARMAMAKIEEERYGFAAAAALYLDDLAQSRGREKTGARSALELRVLNLAWLSQDATLVRRTVTDRALCAEHRAVCERYRAQMPLLKSEMTGAEVSARSARSALRAIKTASAETRAILATIALERPEALSFADRRLAVETIVANWGKTEALARFNLLPRITVSIPKVIRAEREALAHAKVRADERSITGRLKQVQNLEAFAARAEHLPWTRIRVLATNELSSAYQEFARAIRSLPAPRGVTGPARLVYLRMIEKTVAPFESKSASLRHKALELASKPAPDLGALARVSDAAIHAGFNEKFLPHPKAAALDLALLREVDGDGDWKSGANAGTRSEILRTRWTQALEKGVWPQVAFFMQESRQAALLAPATGAAARAVSFAQAGAQAEGRFELSPYCRQAGAKKLADACPAESPGRSRPTIVGSL